MTLPLQDCFFSVTEKIIRRVQASVAGRVKNENRSSGGFPNCRAGNGTGIGMFDVGTRTLAFRGFAIF
jgi:hypothetical protein